MKGGGDILGTLIIFNLDRWSRKKTRGAGSHGKLKNNIDRVELA